MREFDALAGYPKPATPRKVIERGIANRLIAAERGAEFFDGARVNGYGGLKDDGRWAPIAANLIQTYGLAPGARVLQIQAEKGFLLRELQALGLEVAGTETSEYAIGQAVVKLDRGRPDELPYREGMFDFVIALGAVYTLDLPGAVRCLREIQRVGRGKSFITLAAYASEDDFWLMRCWSLLGTQILLKDHWLTVLEHAGYTGDYAFVTAQGLGLRWTHI